MMVAGVHNMQFYKFEGITTDIENKPVSFIFGNVFEDEIEVYDMPLKSELATLF